MTGAPEDRKDAATRRIRRWLNVLSTAGMSRAIAPVSAPREPQWVVTITVDSEAPEAEADAFFDAVAEAVHAFEPRTGWDPHMSASFE